MNRIFPIGLLLPLMYGSVIYSFSNRGERCHDSAERLPVNESSANIRAASLFGMVFQDTASPDELPRKDASRGGGFNSNLVWMGVILFLLFVSGYLLLQVKKTQMLTEQLNAMRREVADLFDLAPCGYHSVNEAGYITNVNQTLAHWLGYEKEELIGKVKFHDVVEAKDHSLIDDTSLLRDGNVEITLLKKAGGAMPVVMSVVRSDRKRNLYASVDNSSCRQLVARIQTLDQELEAFSYSISHDLRAPLRSIDGYSKILQEDYAGKLDDDGRRVLNVVMNNARRMGKLIDDLLEFGRLGRKTMQLAHVDMTAIVKQVFHDLMVQHPARKVNVHIEDIHPALADADMMRQLWFNLLDNAVKYTGKKEHAFIQVRSFETSEGEVCYEVKDNGEGFDMKYAPKLFGVFQRLHKIQDFAGTGVGLAIVKRIISRHGGRVWAEAILNEGAKFFFVIPRENITTSNG